MTPLRAALRMLISSALLLMGGVALSVLTRDAWLIVAQAAGILSATVAGLAVLLLLVVGLRRLAAPPVGDADAPHLDHRGVEGASTRLKRSVHSGA